MVEVTGSVIKLVRSLSQKKARDAEGRFLAEGRKCVDETLGHFACDMIIATKGWAEEHQDCPWAGKITVATERQMRRMSQFSTPGDVIAVYATPRHDVDPGRLPGSLSVALDGVQDPGNLGAIIRLADWFGVDDVYCSPATADAYSHKVVQATMGAISRVRVHYLDLVELLGQCEGIDVYGTFLDGDDIYRASLGGTGLVIFGNEGRGISPQVAALVGGRLLIPSYPAGAARVESLNVGSAVAVVLSEFRRRMT